MGMECKCKICDREYVWKRTSGHTKTTCNSCIVNRRRFALKVRVVDYLGGQCNECGYKKSLAALQVHHLDPSQKKFNISGSHCRAWSVIQDELNKCILLCANCHAELEYGAVYPV